VLDELNAQLRPTACSSRSTSRPANRATLGGMTGNNSCGSRSIRYGNMVHNVHAMHALLADGTAMHVRPGAGQLLDADERPAAPRYARSGARALMRALHAREADEIARRFPKGCAAVGGYNIDMIDPAEPNMAHLLVGSEGTLGFFTAIELAAALPRAQGARGVPLPDLLPGDGRDPAHRRARPGAVELVDRTMIELSREIPMFRPTVGASCAASRMPAAGRVRRRGRDKRTCAAARLDADGRPRLSRRVVEAVDPAFQRAIWDVRKAGLNIMMSMKGDGKPVSFIEDCAVRLEDLAEYTDRLTEVFASHGTSGTWYAHASVGCLHVRPILNLKESRGADRCARSPRRPSRWCASTRARTPASTATGSCARSSTRRCSARIVRAFEEVKDSLRPGGACSTPARSSPPRMDDRT
jgi:FAD/FMN-containing dehydrogenase